MKTEIFVGIVGACCFALHGMAKVAPIPEPIDVGTYIVQCELPSGWRVEVLATQGKVIFKNADGEIANYLRFALQRLPYILSEVLAVRVEIPVELRNSNSESIAEYLREQSADHTKRRKLAQKLYWRNDKWAPEVHAAGTVRFFRGRDRRHRNYSYNLCILLPETFREQGYAFLVFYHEISSYSRDSTDGPRNIAVFKKVIEGIKLKQG